MNAHYDYTHQCWIVDRKIQDCAHPDSMNCKCYGREHAGEALTTDPLQVIKDYGLTITRIPLNRAII